MVLDFEYGVNTANRFLQFVDHDEDPDDFIATQTPTEKKTSKDSKLTSSAASSKKVTGKTTTTTATTTSTSKSSATTGATKTNKENVSGKSGNVDQRRQQSATVPAVFGDNSQQQSRGDNNRGNRGGQRRGGFDRPPYEGGGRGGGQQRSARFAKFEGPQNPSSTNEPSGFEQTADTWGTDASAGGSNDQASFGGRGGGRGRGGPRRGNYEGGSGRGRGNFEGRGRGRGGRGNFNNRPLEEGSQSQGFQQDNNNWQQSTDSNFDSSRPATARTGGQEFDSETSPQERAYESDNFRRGGRNNRGRTFHNRGNYGGDRQNQFEGGEGGQDDYRHNRRQYDRQPRTNVSSVKPIEKKDGEGAHNWGNPTENPEEHPITDETNEQTAAPSSKDWAQQVDEAEKQMTLDEYKKQQEAKKKANLTVVPQFKTRTAGEGEDPKVWQKPEVVYRKKNEGEESEGEGEESGAEESGSGEEDIEEEQATGKKKLISIPLRFNPVEVPRGPGGSRGSRRGSGRYDDRQPRPGGSGFRDRPPRDDGRLPLRSNSPSQQQSPSTQQTGDILADEQQQATSPQYYRGGSRGAGGGSRQGSGRGGDYRRSYANSSRGPRGGGQGRSSGDPYAPALDNPLDFPTLPKQ